jgi:hypothetical protein
LLLCILLIKRERHQRDAVNLRIQAAHLTAARLKSTKHVPRGQRKRQWIFGKILTRPQATWWRLRCRLHAFHSQELGPLVEKGVLLVVSKGGASPERRVKVASCEGDQAIRLCRKQLLPGGQSLISRLGGTASRAWKFSRGESKQLARFARICGLWPETEMKSCQRQIGGFQTWKQGARLPSDRETNSKHGVGKFGKLPASPGKKGGHKRGAESNVYSQRLVPFRFALDSTIHPASKALPCVRYELIDSSAVLAVMLSCIYEYEPRSSRTSGQPTLQLLLY